MPAPADRPHVTVVIPVHNGASYVAQAVESALRQTYRELDVLVVDDGSTDRTPAVLASFDDRIRVLRQENLGVSSARNNAIEAAAGPLIALLDADDVWKPPKLEKQVELWTRDRTLGLVLCGYEVVTEDLGSVRYRVPLDDPRRRIRDAALLQAWGVGLSFTALFPKSVVQEVGPFQSELSTAADLEFALRVASVRPVTGVREPLALYRSHPAQMHRDATAFEKDLALILDRLGESGMDEPSMRARGLANLHVRRAIAELRAGRAVGSAGHVCEVTRHDPSRFLGAPAGALARRLHYGLLARRAP